jgi:hypothetical protein
VCHEYFSRDNRSADCAAEHSQQEAGSEGVGRKEGDSSLSQGRGRGTGRPSFNRTLAVTENAKHKTELVFGFSQR